MHIEPLRTSPWRLLGFETCLVLGIVAVCIGACLHEVRAVLDKVGLVGPLIFMAQARGPTVEHLALTGVLETDSTAPPLAPPADRPQRRLTPRDAGVVIELLSRGAPWRLSMNPVSLHDGFDAHVLWLCGQRRAPAGWTGPAQPLVDGLSVQQLPAVCRGQIE